MTIYKNVYGSWVIGDIVNGYRVERKYYGYGKREAVALFKSETK